MVDETYAKSKQVAETASTLSERAEVSPQLVFRYGFGEVCDVDVTFSASADVGRAIQSNTLESDLHDIIQWKAKKLGDRLRSGRRSGAAVAGAGAASADVKLVRAAAVIRPGGIATGLGGQDSLH